MPGRRATKTQNQLVEKMVDSVNKCKLRDLSRASAEIRAELDKLPNHVTTHCTDCAGDHVYWGDTRAISKDDLGL